MSDIKIANYVQMSSILHNVDLFILSSLALT
jgi:hypothetical protein